MVSSLCAAGRRSRYRSTDVEGGRTRAGGCYPFQLCHRGICQAPCASGPARASARSWRSGVGRRCSACRRGRARILNPGTRSRRPPSGGMQPPPPVDLRRCGRLCRFAAQAAEGLASIALQFAAPRGGLLQPSPFRKATVVLVEPPVSPKVGDGQIVFRQGVNVIIGGVHTLESVEDPRKPVLEARQRRADTCILPSLGFRRGPHHDFARPFIDELVVSDIEIDARGDLT